MTPQTADKTREREIRLIHVAKRELALDDETYRAMLWSVARVKSSSELDWTGRKKVLDHMKARGFKIKIGGNKPANRSADDKRDKRYGKARKLFSLLAEAGEVTHNTDTAFNAYIKRQTAMEHWRFLNGFQINTLIESLKTWCDRAGVKHG